MHVRFVLPGQPLGPASTARPALRQPLPPPPPPMWHSLLWCAGCRCTPCAATTTACTPRRSSSSQRPASSWCRATTGCWQVGGAHARVRVRGAGTGAQGWLSREAGCMVPSGRATLPATCCGARQGCRPNSGLPRPSSLEPARNSTVSLAAACVRQTRTTCARPAGRPCHMLCPPTSPLGPAVAAVRIGYPCFGNPRKLGGRIVGYPAYGRCVRCKWAATRSCAVECSWLSALCRTLQMRMAWRLGACRLGMGRSSWRSRP